MLSSPSRYLALLFLCAAVALPLRSQEAPAGRSSTPDQKNKKTSPTDKSPLPGPMPPADAKMPDLKKMDFSSLPADAVVIVCESVAEGLRRVPDAVILSAKKYQELREEIERLKKMLQAEKAVAPSKCHLKGKVEGDTALVQAEFEGATDRPNAIVTLACRQAWASDARIDGRMPLIRRTEADGFFVQIEKPGKYRVTLDLIVPLSATSSNGRGFELTLPGAAITTLELDLPSNVKDVSAGGHPLSDPQPRGLTLKNHHLAGTPDRMDKLELAWREVRPPSGVPVLTSEGNILVRLDSAGQTTEAELLLQVEGEQRNVWRLLVPPGAEVKLLPPGDGRVQSIEKADQQFASLRTIHLKEPSANPLQVRITVHAPLPGGGSPAPVGPFFVLGATRQTGTVRVRNQVRDLHLDYHGHGDMQLQRLMDEPGAESVRVATFTYSNIPLVDQPRGATGPASLSWLDLEAEIVRSQVRTRVRHALTLQPLPLSASGTGAGDALRWDVLTTIEPVSKWPDVEQFKVAVPPEWMPAEEGITVGTEKDARFVTFRRSELREKASQPIQLRGYYQPPHKSEGHAILKLPRPQGFVDQCTVTIQGPRDSEVVLNNAEQADLELANQTKPNEQTWRFRRALPDGPGIDIAWKPYRPELQVKSVVDLTLNGDRGKVRHEIRLHSPRSLPASITLLVPAVVGESLAVLAGGRLEAPRPEPLASPKRVLRLDVPAQADSTDGRVVLQYTTILAETGEPPPPGEPFGVPLVVPSQATQGETKVRVWGEPGFLPLPSGGSTWDQRPIEEVEGRADLPALVLHASRVDAPLTLRAAEQAPVFTVLVERALVRVQLLEDGGQSYRASFQLRQLAGRFLDVELPGPVPTLKVRITLNQRTVTPDIVNDRGQHTDGGSIARLRLGPDLVRQAALLDVFYQLPPGRTGVSPLRTTLQPPLLRGAPTAVPTRWQVTLPSNRVLIAPESASGLERTWGRDHWLLAARLHRTNADLEREFEESLPAELRRGERFDNPSATPALVCWQDALEPIVLTHAPQQAWLLVCSLGLLVLGLGLYWSARPQPSDAGQMAPWFWPILALVTLAIALGVLFWPTALWAVIFGCEPGAVVLLGVIGFQWLMHQRYRRQIVFLPSFSRSPASSSLLRKSSSHRPPPGEPSTVDAPPPANSST
jgi:hypothetical protein